MNESIDLVVLRFGLVLSFGLMFTGNLKDEHSWNVHEMFMIFLIFWRFDPKKKR